MESFQTIRLSFKCPKAFDELQPCNNNWYCDGCQKMVYDFRGMTEEQILDAFAKSGQKLCGIYEANRIKVLPQYPKWFRWSWAAVMTLGVAILNSCGFGQKDRTITTSGVLLPPPPAHKTIMGEPADTPKKDRVAHHQKNKTIKIKFPPPVVMGDVEAQNVSLGIADPGVKWDTVNSNIIIDSFETSPKFPGGEAAWNKYVYERIKYSGEYQGRVYIQFVVESDGTLTDIKVLKGGDPELNEQLIGIIKKSPRWQPGTQKGKPVRQPFTVPLNFIYRANRSLSIFFKFIYGIS